MDSSANRPGTSKSDGGWMGSSWGGSASYSFRGWLTKLRGGGEKVSYPAVLVSELYRGLYSV